MISLYQLKPRFQALLRPLVRLLYQSGVTANMVTMLAMLCSVGLGMWLYFFPEPCYFLLLPIWMFLRMALNAIDGMLAREFGQASPLGRYLNELCDVVADAALYLPFVWIAPFGWGSIVTVIFVASLSEMTGVMGQPRCYHGPMGKSDRAFVFGALGLWLGCVGSLPTWLFWLMPILVILMMINIVKRIQAGIKN